MINSLGVALRQSKENIEIVPQEACVQHKGPETMLQERQARSSLPLKKTSEARDERHRMPPSLEQKRLSVI
ncbi:hypothetical protein OESDEN_16870 [Oesophagostomum dentatum]|uniref:Uncharacterized protein n=1 Tax=Oesophagostomum dentatum TaxID=61180 RepID=A0A0B1SDP0_OESDE|nr:hypothetical protein OESDEN_16870 [Oesophagostomum dentatum]